MYVLYTESADPVNFVLILKGYIELLSSASCKVTL